MWTGGGSGYVYALVSGLVGWSCLFVMRKFALGWMGYFAIVLLVMRMI